MSFHGVRDGEDMQIVIVIDGESGDSRDLLVRNSGEVWLYLVPFLSTSAHVALASEPFEDAMADDGGVAISLLDLQTSDLSPDAFRIDLP